MIPAKRVRAVGAAAMLAAIVAAAQVAGEAQRPDPADLAAKLSGTWRINRELSPGFSAPRGRGPAPGRGGLPSLAISAVAPQGRGGRGGGSAGAPSSVSDASDLTPAERAALSAMQQLQSIAEEITITATADSVTFTEYRSERTFPINDRTTKLDVNGAEVTAKTKWDRATLRQEFSTPRTRLTRRWDIDQNGRLVLSARIESMSLSTVEQKAVFDRK
jgi:hypothetical protein